MYSLLHFKTFMYESLGHYTSIFDKPINTLLQCTFIKKKICRLKCYEEIFIVFNFSQI